MRKTIKRIGSLLFLFAGAVLLFAVTSGSIDSEAGNIFAALGTVVCWILAVLLWGFTERPKGPPPGHAGEHGEELAPPGSWRKKF